MEHHSLIQNMPNQYGVGHLQLQAAKSIGGRNLRLLAPSEIIYGEAVEALFNHHSLITTAPILDF